VTVGVVPVSLVTIGVVPQLSDGRCSSYSLVTVGVVPTA
jgi:hypothetical protein